MKFQQTKPLDFKLASWAMSKSIPGSWTFYRSRIQSKYKDHVFSFLLPDGSSIWMPADWPKLFLSEVFEAYEPNAIDLFAKTIDEFGQPATVVDCGADVGVFSRLVAAKTHNISKLHCVEPNDRSYAILERNVATTPFLTACFRGGVGAVSGQGSLVSPDASAHAHAFFIDTQSPDGDVPITTIDHLVGGTDGPIALKIDVEGLEMDVLQGARAVLQAAPSFVVQFEAHPDVSRRCGIDPMACIRFLHSIRPCQFTACQEATGEVISVKPGDGSFFNLVHQDQIYDIVAVSKN